MIIVGTLIWMEHSWNINSDDDDHFWIFMDSDDDHS